MLLAGDLGHEKNCVKAIAKIIKNFERIDILVNNAAEQHPQESLLDITEKQLEKTFSQQYLFLLFSNQSRAPLSEKRGRDHQHFVGDRYRGSPQLLDYSSTKGAIVRIYTFACTCTRQAKYARQWRRAGASLDAVDSLHISG